MKRNWVIFVVVLVIVAIGVLIAKKNVYVVEAGDFKDFPRQTFSMPRVQIKDRLVLKWIPSNYTAGYGDIAEICLQALDDQGKAIKVAEGVDGDGCSYGMYQFHNDLYVTALLGTTSVSSGEYIVKVNNWDKYFVSKPSQYRLGVVVLDYLPPEGRSEWAGLVHLAYSNLFQID